MAQRKRPNYGSKMSFRPVQGYLWVNLKPVMKIPLVGARILFGFLARTREIFIYWNVHIRTGTSDTNGTLDYSSLGIWRVFQSRDLPGAASNRATMHQMMVIPHLNSVLPEAMR